MNDVSLSKCEHCSASLKDAVIKRFCDRCGVPLPDAVQPIGKCVTCGKSVFLCIAHEKKLADDEIYCKEHESECFIATAVFGTHLHPQLDVLRQLRDEWLLTKKIGRVAVSTYYEVSPPIARAARRRPILKELLRQFIVEPALRVADAVLKKK
jgi:hypothetical protein